MNVWVLLVDGMVLSVHMTKESALQAMAWEEEQVDSQWHCQHTLEVKVAELKVT